MNKYMIFNRAESHYEVLEQCEDGPPCYKIVAVCKTLGGAEAIRQSFDRRAPR